MPTENKIDCPALHQRSDSYPYGDRVPRTVRMLKTVTADPMPGIGLAYIKGNAPVAKAGQTYPVRTNSHGAVTAVMDDGTRLGLRPAEFEVDSWHDLAAAPAPQPHPEPIAWMVGTALWWTKEEAERDAEAMGLRVIAVGPMGDIGLAREMLRRAARRESKWARLCGGRNDQIAELRAQLAEAQEVLRDCIEVGELNAETEWKALRVSKGRRLYVDDRAMATLAKSSTTVECAICRDLGDQCVECEESDFREWADRHFAAADYRKTDAGVFIQDWMRHAYGAWCARGAMVRQP